MGPKQAKKKKLHSADRARWPMHDRSSPGRMAGGLMVLRPEVVRP